MTVSSLVKDPCDVLLLAAGYGKRLRPLTESIPKPLIVVAGKTLLDWNLDIVERAGIEHVFINAHHLREQIHAHLAAHPRTKLKTTIVDEPVLLDTGGAIKNIESQLRHSRLITINSDILLGPEFYLEQLVDAHRGAKDGRVATLCLREDVNAAAYGGVEVDPGGVICGFLGKEYRRATAKRTVMYIGVQILERKVLDYMPSRGEIFSITRDTHVKMLQAGEVLGGLLYDGYWNDAGTPERLAEASRDAERIYGVSRRP